MGWLYARFSGEVNREIEGQDKGAGALLKAAEDALSEGMA
jgi:hypothetical protein